MTYLRRRRRPDRLVLTEAEQAMRARFNPKTVAQCQLTEREQDIMARASVNPNSVTADVFYDGFTREEFDAVKDKIISFGFPRPPSPHLF